MAGSPLKDDVMSFYPFAAGAYAGFLAQQLGYGVFDLGFWVVISPLILLGVIDIIIKTRR